MEGLVDGAFWKGRRVFLTGHTGFKGSWLAFWLRELGAEVSGYALPPAPSARLFAALGLDRTVASHFGDISELDALSRRLADAGSEVVFHLAGQPFVRAGYRDPAGTFRTNLLGTVHLLEAVRCVPSVAAAVVVTSDKVYAAGTPGPDGIRPYREDDALGGDDPYAASKAAAERVVESYRRAMFPGRSVAVATARAGNVLGGGDWGEDRIVPDLLRALDGTRRLALRNPAAHRPWQHVLDVLNGYLVLAEYLVGAGDRFAAGWNFGPPADRRVGVLELAGRFLDRWGDTVEIVTRPDPAAPEAQALAIDSGKSRREMGWSTRLDFDATLAWTVDWYKAFAADPGKAVAVSRRQIEDFMRT